MKKVVWLIALCAFVSSCSWNDNSIQGLYRKWIQKKIEFPDEMVFTKFAHDTVSCPDLSGYKIVIYADSIGCFTCKMNLRKWNDWLTELDSVTNGSVPALMFISTNRKIMISEALRNKEYSHPVIVDSSDEFNRLNHLPEDDAFRTFLLDSANRVVAIGNPIHNPKVAKLYHKILGVSASSSQPESNSMSLGSFPWQKPQTVMFKVPNRGAEPLTLDSITTSCECTTASCAKNEALPGDTLFVSVTYTAEQAGEFMREVYLHLANSAEPKVLTITGNAQ